MVIKGSDLLGLKITAKEGQEVGNVQDIIYDPKKNEVIALLVSKGDVLSEPNVIPFTEILQITSEGVDVKSEKSLQPGSKAVKSLSTPEDTDTYMKDTNIISEEGNPLGQERDIFFDTKTGIVQQFEVMQDNQVKQVKVSTVISSTDSTTTIKVGEPQEKSPEGILDKLKQAMGS
jgi:uncharacterized protein YrrD